ncbi:MAG: prepilin peptidase [Candidatus Velthaea sp.]
MTLLALMLPAATLVAAAIDVRVRRIPNALTGGLAVAGIALHVPQGVSPTVLAVAAMLAAFVAGSLAFSAGWFGGGDVKLIAACCAVAGFPGSGALVLEILAAGAVLALVWAAAGGRLFSLVRSTTAVALRGAPLESNTLPYGVAIAAGSIFYTASSLVPALRLPV